jgi:hypothetical protein
MKIFYSQFRVKPTRKNEKYDLIEGALAHCWIKETNPQNAYAKAELFVRKSDWEIAKVEEHPIEVNESNFSGKDLGQENYLKAPMCQASCRLRKSPRFFGGSPREAPRGASLGRSLTLCFFS